MPHMCEWVLTEETVPDIYDRIEEVDEAGKVTAVTYGARNVIVLRCECGNQHHVPGVLKK